MSKTKPTSSNLFTMFLLLSYLLTVFWLGLIFYLSAQVAEVSNQLSTGITEKVIIVIKKVVPQSQLEAADLNHFIRKNAHFFAYLLLGIFISNSLFLTWLKVQGQPDCHLAAWSPGRVWLASWVFCLFYAVTDELHQHFVPGRGCQLRDVLLDSAGAAVGVLLYLFGAHILGRHKKAGLFEF